MLQSFRPLKKGGLQDHRGYHPNYAWQAAVDLELLVDYGVAIPDLARAVRRNVITAIERMTGLEAVEVNIHVNDVYVGDEDDESSQHASRVE